ncbi:hypothetical protein NECAME_08165 [Necator americanus]|uniref:Neurotransmitter-gated ion-channel ligand-binding domain-containing protein n=1 Tax=Necator americanus TaxID=51031 RepID=W2TJ30_NECAM|nr:hypothetical protein NECAME_08165 [Necator americanus]ETN82115.1 hypothetical protein NECAME_08165 [Necator americanus]
MCTVNFVSYNFPSNEIRTVASIFKSYNISSASNGEWTVEKLSFEIFSTLTNTSNYNYDVTAFTFRLRRNSIFYVVLIIIPSFVLAFLCVLGLFWSKFDHNDYLEKLYVMVNLLLVTIAISIVVMASKSCDLFQFNKVYDFSKTLFVVIFFTTT